MLRDVAAALRAEARATNERRLLVLTGSRDACDAGVEPALDAAGFDADDVTVLGERELPGGTHLPPERAGELLGTTRPAVVVDCHDACRPNALGQAVGAVDGGGLLLVLCPPFSTWPDRRDGFDEGLAVPPFGVEDVSGNFRRRLVETLRIHPGIAIIDVDSGAVQRDGLTDPAPRRPSDPPTPPAEHDFPRAAYEACLTGDQVAAVRALEALREPGNAVVLEADRGRGKSSAAGLAAGALAAAGRDVLVTAPGYRNAREVFARAGELLADLDVPADVSGDDHLIHVRAPDGGDGGRVRFLPPTAATDRFPAASSAASSTASSTRPPRCRSGCSNGFWTRRPSRSVPPFTGTRAQAAGSRCAFATVSTRATSR